MDVSSLVTHAQKEVVLNQSRKLIRRSPHRRVGLISCPWLQTAQIEYESLLEKSFVRIALLCPFVKTIKSQPFRLPLSDGKSYTPDYLLSCLGSEQVVIEVKPQVFITKHKNRLDEAKHLLEQNGYTFLICSDSSIHFNNRHEQASLFLRFACSTEVDESIARLRSKTGEMSFPQSFEALCDRLALNKYQLMGLIGRRELFLPPDFNMNLIFSLDAYKKERKDESISPGSWLNYSR